MTGRNRFALTIAGAIALTPILCGGCASTPVPTLTPTYVELYQSGRWAEAQTAAAARAKELPSGLEREQAMLLVHLKPLLTLISYNRFMLLTNRSSVSPTFHHVTSIAVHMTS